MNVDDADHRIRPNRHHIDCYCDLCACDAHIFPIRFYTCTCELCDPTEQADIAMELARSGSHHDGCFCDLCDGDPHYVKIGFSRCTCDACDPDHEAQDLLDEAHSKYHHSECYCDICSFDGQIRPMGFKSCTCDACDQDGEAIKAGERARRNYKNDHHIGCYCDLCNTDSIFPAMGFTTCTCSKCDPEGLVQFSTGIETKKPLNPTYTEICILKAETSRRAIEIFEDSSGYINVSALDKLDMFTGEIVWVLDMKEAREEVTRFRSEDISSAVENGESDDEEFISPIPTGTVWYDGTSFSVVVTHEGSGIYTIERLYQGELIEDAFCDSPGTAALIRDRYITQLGGQPQ